MLHQECVILPAMKPRDQYSVLTHNIPSLLQVPGCERSNIDVDPFACSTVSWGVGGTVDSKPALRSAKTLMSRIRANPSAP
ncbi:hypothetical protein PoB_006901400 [Plakobranchus ocellatus]|uniref:Uncharacterized protein n=1 Tax=Plakobranchus ocellatus TaxID=259542 RepID=A0AAV4DEG7_9GAST|nr:hypothetical protein PoB_006901400 [Plakobranchus ocellatus]